VLLREAHGRTRHDFAQFVRPTSHLTREVRNVANIEELAWQAIDCGFAIHRDLGPGLFESVYETLMASLLERRGLRVECQKPISFTYENIILKDAFRADLLVEGKLLIELKSVEKAAPVYPKQLLTYLRLMDLPLGLLMNFGAPTFKEGLQRILNSKADLTQIEIRGR
jgi:GxxExxY protein